MSDEPRSNRAGALALLLAAATALTLVAAGPLYRAERITLPTAFTMLRWAAYAGIGSFGLAIVGIILGVRRGRGTAAALVALVIGVGSLALPATWLRRASRAPRIHDISTDTEHPPAFVAAVPLRAGAANSAEYGGAAVAAQQRQAYPDIAPVTLAVPPNQAFDRALQVAGHMGWELVASDPTAGRIEATDTTYWFGFNDDIVIRVAAAPGGSRVDVRSLSRVGVSDVGTNAARIRKYVAALKATS